MALNMTDPDGVHKKVLEQVCKNLEAKGPKYANDDWDEENVYEASFK